jgi:DNA-binding response OmpR family regulator
MTISKGRILCTEDDADTRELLTVMLGLSEYEVTCADSAVKALELIKKEKFDLLLLDNWMPGVSGESLCLQIREFDSTTPILFYSGAAYQTDKDRALAAGAQGYLVKPVIESELIAEVVRIIAKSNIAVPVAIVPPEQSRPVRVGE